MTLSLASSSGSSLGQLRVQRELPAGRVSRALCLSNDARRIAAIAARGAIGWSPAAASPFAGRALNSRSNGAGGLPASVRVASLVLTTLMRSACKYFAPKTLVRLAVVSLCGCSSLGNCPDGMPDITVDTGTTDHAAGTYQSTPIWGPRVAFPAKTTMHFVHDLGFSPEIMQSFVSFRAEGSDASENAGNQALWKCVDDKEFVVRNDTCQDFYIVVSAYGSGTQHAPCECNTRKVDGSCP